MREDAAVYLPKMTGVQYEVALARHRFRAAAARPAAVAAVPWHPGPPNSSHGRELRPRRDSPRWSVARGASRP